MEEKKELSIELSGVDEMIIGGDCAGGAVRAGSYILTSNASNTVEFDMPAYPGLHPGFPVASHTC